MLNLFDALARHASAKPNAVALQGSGCALSYSELLDEVARAAALIERHCCGSAPVALRIDNSPAWAVLDLALLQSGRVCVPLPPFFTPQQQDHALRQSGAQHIIDAASAPSWDCVAGMGLAFRPWDAAEVALPAGTAKVTFTSGSTGTPKGICLSGAMLAETAASILDSVGGAHGALHCALLPLSVLLENVAGLYAVLMSGGTYCLPSPAEIGLGNPFAPDVMRLVAALQAMRATSIITVPELLRGLITALSMTRQTIPSLTFIAVGGARVSPRLLAQAQVLGLPVHEGYGLSEAGSVVALNVPGAARAGTAGRLLPHVRARLGEDGELLIDHPKFLGYAGGATAAGVLATGDLVAQDPEGYLSIIGRKSSLIITGYGRNIAPEWIESELLAQPVIAQACVHGDGDSALSALLVPVSGHVTGRQVAAAVEAANASLPPYAAVTAWRIVPPFTPMNGQLTANGRLRRQAIAAAHARSATSHHYPQWSKS